MGHSILIGWYNPTSKRFCYKDEKETRPKSHKSKTLPVYAVLEDGMRKDLETENKRLGEALLEYGRHGRRSNREMCERDKHSDYPCTCGFEQALKGSQ